MDPSLPPDQLPPRIVAFIAGLSLLGGLSHFLGQLRAGRHRSHWAIELAADLAYALAAGFLVWYAATAHQVNPYLTAALSITAGHLGAKLIYVIQTGILERAEQALATATRNDKAKENDQ
jgi:hypothetical protein